MGVDVVIGGQGGDEGKGKISAYLAKTRDYAICMRVPAPQAGHSIHYNGKRIGLSLLPCGLVNPNTRLLIGTGGLISVEKLMTEINETGISPERLGIDEKATIVTKEHVDEETNNQYLMGEIGSVGKGISACRRDKIMRKPDLKFAKNIPELKQYLTDTKKEIIEVIKKKGKILLEVDQGAKLDLVHGEYPFVTSKSTNASAALGDAGIGARYVDDVYVVLKPYTTRVAQGPLNEEIFDEELLNWAHDSGGETGTVSKRKRRIGKFEWDNVKRVMEMNSVTKIAITHMDCIDDFRKSLGFRTQKDFIEKLKRDICKCFPYPRIALLSYGPREEDVKEYDEKSFKDFCNAKNSE